MYFFHLDEAKLSPSRNY